MDVDLEIARLPQRHSDVWSLFTGLRGTRDAEPYERLLGDDAVRDDFLKKAGIETMRISSLDLVDPDPVKRSDHVHAIARRCRERAGISHPQPPPSKTTTLRDGASEHTYV